MLIRSKPAHHLRDCDVTPETVYRERRRLLRTLGLGGAALGASALTTPAQAGLLDRLFGAAEDEAPQDKRPTLAAKPAPDYREAEEVTPEAKATNYNNFYEFGTDKADPARNSAGFTVEPWTVEIAGEVENPIRLDVWEMIHGSQLEERIYRLRCVEAWSMVVPWIGIELNKLIKPAKPTSRAKFVAFETLYDPEQMPGQRSRFSGGGIDYPYREGLRIDEAMHPLTLMVVGMYGKTLPPQNGAPLRLMSPWKYGFKAIKSIVRIELMEKMPPTSWNQLAPQEYGFYANVNPEVDHPRWSQASERFIGEGHLASRQATLLFNGYGDDVASLYAGMNLRKWY